MGLWSELFVIFIKKSGDLGRKGHEQPIYLRLYISRVGIDVKAWKLLKRAHFKLEQLNNQSVEQTLF